MKVTREESLRARDLEILDGLTRRVRLFSVDQVAGVWWGSTASPRANAARRLANLESRGFLRRITVMAHASPELERPLASWRPGEAAPDFSGIAYRLESRWHSPLEPTAAVVATRAAGAWLGGAGGQAPTQTEASHDLGLAALFLRMRSKAPPRASSWLYEDLLGDNAPPGFLPDAMLLSDGERTAIEFAGVYDKHRLSRLHVVCEREELPYELW